MHNDQHGAAVVILGALLNALKVVKRAIQDITVVAIGPGAAGIVCCEWLLGAGITRLRGCDKHGWVLHQPITELRPHRHNLHALIQYDAATGTIQDALKMRMWSSAYLPQTSCNLRISLSWRRAPLC
jgi:malate dehydrogenase (oxaloacetate-decarboxylating)